MPHATRRTLFATAPTLVAGGAAAAPAKISEVAAVYAAYKPFLRINAPRERDFLIVEIDDDESSNMDDIDYVALDAAQVAWGAGRGKALQHLIAARARTLEDLEAKLRIAVEDMRQDDGEADEELVSSCLRDIKTMQTG